MFMYIKEKEKKLIFILKTHGILKETQDEF